jgi:trimethylamine--corrinoid protein Co-methyltransferase
MPADRPPIEPIRSDFKFQFLRDEQLKQLQGATLQIMEHVGVQFPSEKALEIFAGHGVIVDHETKIVKLPRDLVFKAMKNVPRYFHLGARDPAFDLHLEDGLTYFTTDGCGVETIDFKTRERRPSNKADVGMMARVADYLSSIAFYWPMVSAQDHGRTAPLHELDTSWNNTIKHIQSETLMGEVPARYAIEMATVLNGDKEDIRRRPPFSVLICTIAPLVQDKEGIEGALYLAEAGIPVGFLSMPTMGTTAPTTYAGALAMGDAECISATVLMQLAHPGAPVFHSIMHASADPRTGSYVGYPLNTQHRFAAVEIAHHWGMPTLGGAFGTDSPRPGTWQSAAEIALDPFWIGMTGAELVTGIGLDDTYTLLYPEAIILDNDIYERARYGLMDIEISPETLAVDVTRVVGPGGHFLSQKHTRKYMRDTMKRSLAQELDAEGKYRDPVEVARERLAWILENHQPEPLEPSKQAELTRILDAADREMNQ